MYIHVHESMYKYNRHVCTMFSSVHTDLPYPVQVVRIPDEREGLVSEDLKSVGALVPIGQMCAVWIRTRNLSLTKRNALTTEPRLHI